MSFYIRNGKGGSLENVYSPVDATRFTRDEANKIRVKAFEQWHDLNWDIVCEGNEFIVKAEKEK